MGKYGGILEETGEELETREELGKRGVKLVLCSGLFTA